MGTKGRPPGQKNLRTEKEIQFRDHFQIYCYSGGFSRFMEELKALKGKQYCEFFLKALEFNAPKLTRTDINLGENNTILISLNPPNGYILGAKTANQAKNDNSIQTSGGNSAAKTRGAGGAI